MLKKYVALCVVLTSILVIPLPTLAGNSTSGLNVSNVNFSATSEGTPLTYFPEENSRLFADTIITNKGQVDEPAVLWVGIYRNSVLIDIEYCRKIIPAGGAETLNVPAISIPIGSNRDNTVVKAYVWDSFTGANALAPAATFLADNLEVKSISIDDVNIGGFSNEKTDYNYIVNPNTITKRPKITAVPKDNSTKIEISDYSIPGQATVKLTTVGGATKIFTIQMKFTRGTVTNILNNISSKTYRAFYDLRPQSLGGLRSVYMSEGSGWEEYCRAYVDRGLVATGGISTGSAPAANGGQIPGPDAAHTGTGEYLKDYATNGGSGWCTMWYATGTKLDETGNISDYFIGASWIATGNSDNAAPYYLEDHPDGITFTTDRGATLWVATQNGNSANLISNGWTKSTGEKRVVHGDGAQFTIFYTKHFEAGQVQIPTAGASVGRMYMPIIIWDEPSGIDNTKLTGVQYRLSDKDAYQAVVENESPYTVYVPKESAGHVPQLKVITEDSRAEVEITFPERLPGSAVITITAVNGQTQIYQVDFLVVN